MIFTPQNITGRNVKVFLDGVRVYAHVTKADTTAGYIDILVPDIWVPRRLHGKVRVEMRKRLKPLMFQGKWDVTNSEVLIYED